MRFFERCATIPGASDPILKEHRPLASGPTHLGGAVRVGLEKSDDEWINSSGVKSQMQRMDSTFKERALGFSSFRAFVESRSDVVESQMRNNIQKVRVR